MKCPRDSGDMKEIEKDGVVVDICENCTGVWFDNREFEKFDEVHEKGG